MDDYSDDYTLSDARDDELADKKKKAECWLRDNDEAFCELCQFVALLRKFGYAELADQQDATVEAWIQEELEQQLEIEEEHRDPYGYRGLRRSDFH